METPDKRPSLPVTIRSIKVQKKCVSCIKIPSEENCIKCVLNMYSNFSEESLEDGSLSLAEIIAKYDNDLENINRILNLFIQASDVIREKRRNMATELIKQSIVKGNVEEVQFAIDESNSKFDKKRLPINGFMHIIAKKIGYFFFNPENKSGLNMPKMYQDAITDFICKLFEQPNGSSFSQRTIGDNIAEGGNMAHKEEFGSK